MKKLVAILLFALAIFTKSTLAQEEVVLEPPKQEFLKAEVLEVLEESTQEEGEAAYGLQKLKVKIISGAEKGSETEVDFGYPLQSETSNRLKKGQKIILSKIDYQGEVGYNVTDHYRQNRVKTLIAIFFFLVILLAGLKGIGSILGMLTSLVVIAKFIVPQIISGKNPLLITITGALIIMVLSLYLAHGFSKKTSIAAAGTFISLVLTGLLAAFFVSFTKLTGLGSEESMYLSFFGSEPLNMKGILLGGIIIGSLGVLDDVTIGQAATAWEIHQADKKLPPKEIFMRTMLVGKEHVASMVNTLILAYAGSSLAIFLLLNLNQEIPLWVTLNSELIVEEIVRSLAGSIGLLLAVPITTALASVVFQRGVNPNNRPPL